MNYNKTISDRVLEQIKKDVLKQDLSALEAMISVVPRADQLSYLPEEQWNEFKIGSTRIVDRPDDKIEYYIENKLEDIIEYSDDYDVILIRFEELKKTERDMKLFVILVSNCPDGSVNDIDREVLDSYVVD